MKKMKLLLTAIITVAIMGLCMGCPQVPSGGTDGGGNGGGSEAIEMEEVLVEVEGTNGDTSFFVAGRSGKPTPIVQTEVKLTKNYYMGKYEVTRSQFATIMGNQAPASDVANKPIVNITHLQALNFCNDLSTAEGLTPYYTIVGEGLEATITPATSGEALYGYRLPTEVEWEYAARGGQHRDNHNLLYSGSDDVSTVGVAATTKQPGNLQEVGSLAANALGIYNMSGNAAEMCYDFFINTTYPDGTKDENGVFVDPTGIDGTRGTTATVRRGATLDNGDVADLNHRVLFVAKTNSGEIGKNAVTGFRVVRTEKPQA